MFCSLHGDYMKQTQYTDSNSVLSIALIKEMERMLDEIQTIDFGQIMDFMINRLQSGLYEPLFPSKYDLGISDNAEPDDSDLTLVNSYFDNIASIPTGVIEKASTFKKRITQAFTQDEINNGKDMVKQLKVDLIKMLSNIYFLHKKEYDHALHELEDLEKEYNENKTQCAKKYKVRDISELENRINLCKYHHHVYVIYAEKCEQGMAKVLSNHCDFIESLFTKE